MKVLKLCIVWIVSFVLKLCESNKNVGLITAPFDPDDRADLESPAMTKIFET